MQARSQAAEWFGVLTKLYNFRTKNKDDMNEEGLRKLMQSGFEKLRPHIEGMTAAMMECYQQGFKDCWKVLTGKDF